jgi:hypothetical protein
MEFLRWPVIAIYLGTPLLLVYWWVRLATLRAGRRLWPMPVALGLWLAQAGVLFYFIAIGMSGHFRPTPLEEHGPAVLLIAAYIGIGWMLWLSRNRIGA